MAGRAAGEAARVLGAVEDELVALQVASRKQQRLLRKEQKVLGRGGYPPAPVLPETAARLAALRAQARGLRAELGRARRAAEAEMAGAAGFVESCGARLVAAVSGGGGAAPRGPPGGPAPPAPGGPAGEFSRLSPAAAPGAPRATASPPEAAAAPAGPRAGRPAAGCSRRPDSTAATDTSTSRT